MLGKKLVLSGTVTAETNSARLQGIGTGVRLGTVVAVGTRVGTVVAVGTSVAVGTGDLALVTA